MKNKLLYSLTHNLGLKILALVFATGLWFIVNNITDPTVSKPFNNIHVEIVNGDMITNEGKVYEVLDGTDTINVKVRGKQSILSNITKDDIKAVADMSELTFMNTVNIKVSSTRNNADIEFYDMSTDNMKLSIEDTKREQLMINTVVTGEPAEGYIVGAVTMSQNLVRISGTESVIDQIDHVGATVDVSTYTSDINTNVDLKLYDANDNEIKSNSVKMNISTVNVTVSILATKDVPVKFVIPDEPAEGYRLTDNIISVPETVKIAGKKNVIDGVSEIVVNDSALSVEGEESDKTTIINVKKYLPTGTQFADSEFNGNVSVTIGIEPEMTKSFSVPVKNFAIDNVPNGFKASILEFANKDVTSYNITATGAEDDIKGLSEKSIVGVLDMDIIKNKLNITEWTPGNYTAEIIFNLSDDVVLQQTYSLTIVVEEDTTDTLAETDNADKTGREDKTENIMKNE